MSNEKFDVWIRRIDLIGSAILKWGAIFSFFGGTLWGAWKIFNPQLQGAGFTQKVLFHGLVIVSFLLSLMGMCAATAHSLISLYFAHKGKWVRNTIYFLFFFLVAFVTAYELCYRIGPPNY